MSMIEDVEIVYWTYRGNDPPLIADVREALSNSNLNSNHAPNIGLTSAFRRAVDSLQDKKQIREHEGRLTSKCFVRRSDKALCAQFDYTSEENGHLKREVRSIYSFQESGVQLEMGEDINLPAMYAMAVRKYNWGDVSEIIKDILNKDGLGCYSPRAEGVIYFVPTQSGNAEILGQLENFCRRIHMRFDRIQIPNTSSFKEEIAESIVQGFQDKFDTHAKSISDYGEITRPGVIDNRQESIRITLEMVGKLSHLMMGRATLLTNRANELLVSCETAKQVIERAAPRGGRRILTH